MSRLNVFKAFAICKESMNGFEICMFQFLSDTALEVIALREDNVNNEENNEKQPQKKKRKGEDLITRESLGAVFSVFTLFAFLILVTGGLIFGGLGTAIRFFLLGVFGYSAYLLLPAAFIASLSLFIGKRFFKRRGRVFVLSAFLISVFLLVHGSVTFRWSSEKYLSSCYMAASDSPWRATPAGFFGALVVYPLKRLTTSVGVIIILAVVTLTLGYLVFRLFTGKRLFSGLVRSERRGERRKKSEDKRFRENETVVPTRPMPSGYPTDATPVAPTYSGPAYPQANSQGAYPPPHREPPRETAYSENAYSGTYGQPHPYGGSPEIRQRPGVTLSDSDGYGKPVQNAANSSNAFSPFAASTWGGTPAPSAQKEQSDDPRDYATGRDFLFSSTPAESYRRNLIFDQTSNANRRPAVEPTQPDYRTSASPFGGSYTSAYADSVNSSVQPARPEKILSDNAPLERGGYSADYGSSAYGTDRYATRQESPVQNPVSEERGSAYARSVETRESYVLRSEPTPVVRPEPVVDAGERELPTESSRMETRFDRASTPEPVRDDFTRPTAPEHEASPELNYRSLFSPSNPNLFGRSEGTANERTPYEAEEKPVNRRDIFDDEEEVPARGSGTTIPEPTDAPRGDSYSLRTEFPESRAAVEEGRENLREDFRGDYRRDFVDREATPLSGREAERGLGLSRDPARESERKIPRETERSREAFRDEARSEPPKPVEPPKPKIIRPYRAAPLDFFNCQDVLPDSNAQEVEENKRTILDTLEAFKVTDATIASVTYGPTVTRYNVAIPRNISPKKVVSLDQEIAMNLYAANGVNIYPNFEDGAVSIEVPNKKRQFVTLGCMIADDRFLRSKPTALTFTMGKDVGNEKVYGDIRKMTHLLVAGASGSGKSVFLRALIISLLMRYSPADLRLILIDPKKTEFVIYDNLPHLVINEIITETNKVIQSLNWAIGEMNRRYGLFEQKSRAGTYVVNIDEYNENLAQGEEKLPKIVIIVDELADLMLAAKKDIEDRIQNLTQKSRAAGIHMIIATQRPSADVITGVIKSNLKTRIAFSVASDIDSRVILDASGAQKLLGYGDMLYTKEGTNTPIRVQSPNIESEDAQKVVNYIKANNDCVYDENVSAYINNTKTPSDSVDSDGDEGGVEEVYVEALRYIVLSGSASISMIQRKCSVGYNKAGKIIEWMEDMGYISAFDGAKARKVLITKEEFEEKYGPL